MLVVVMQSSVVVNFTYDFHRCRVLPEVKPPPIPLLKLHLHLLRYRNGVPNSSFFCNLRRFDEVATSNYTFSQHRGDDSMATPLTLLIRRSDGLHRYTSDGDCFKLELVDECEALDTMDEGFSRILRSFTCAVGDVFIPRQVPANYMNYVKWKFLHRVSSSALQVLATQAMFGAIGIRHSSSLISAASLNWVLKDGLGKVSRCVFTAWFGNAFDCNLKSVRFSVAILFSLSMGFELLTPLFPQHFLLLASVANIAKQISLACYFSTGSAVYRSFAISDNICEVSAKAQIQTVCFDNIGLMLAAFMNILFKNCPRFCAGLPFVMYPIFVTFDLLGTYQALKQVHLQTLTKERLLIILETWITEGKVLSPEEVSKVEGIKLSFIKEKTMWPIRIGSFLPTLAVPVLSADTVKSLTLNDFYFISPEFQNKGFPHLKSGGILLCFREGVNFHHVISGFLQAMVVQKSMVEKSVKWGGDTSCKWMEKREWTQVLEKSKKVRDGNGEVEKVKVKMEEKGWALNSAVLLLSGQVEGGWSLSSPPPTKLC